jgi:cytidylate kinase
MRDYIDSHREVSPLRKADDAIMLDNSELTMPQQLEIAKKWVKERMEKASQK